MAVIRFQAVTITGAQGQVAAIFRRRHRPLAVRRAAACLDRMLITSERHLRLVLSEYTDHYNQHRPHRTLQQNPPAGRPYPPALGASVRVIRRDRLGGLIREYAQVA